MSSPRFAFPLRPIAAAVLSLAAAFTHATPLAVDLPVQSLTTSIQQLSRLSGLSIGGDASLLEGKTAPAIKGNLEPVDALRKLLEGSGLGVSFEGNKAVVGKIAPVLKEVMVAGDAVAIPKEGSAEVGYKPTTAKTTGPWGDKPILDTPYSIHVTPAELMGNMITGTSDQLIKFNPLMKPGSPSIYDGRASAFMRGLSSYAVMVDGIPIGSFWLSGETEGMERMELLSGLSGFLYGAGNVGGILNYVTKRPTATPLANLTVGNYGGSQYFAHVDLGGPIDKEGKFAYRFNALYQDGKDAIDIGLKRANVNVAVDWNLTDALKISITAGHNDYKRTGAGGFAYTQPGPVPSASDFDNKRTMTPNWGFNHLEQDRVGGTLRWDIDDQTTLRAAVQYLEQTRLASASPITMTLLSNGNYRYNAYFRQGDDPKNKGGYLYLDRKFDTFDIQHKVTLGANFNGYDVYTSYGDPVFSMLSAEYPTLVAAQNSPPLALAPIPRVPKYRSNHFMNKNIVLGDDITFNQYFSLLVGVNHSTIETARYTKTGTMTASYDKSAVTPSASLIFKPTSNVSLYGSYIESLESGGAVSLTANPPYANAGEILEPTISKQVELGAKTNLGGVFLTLAAFQINKANLYDTANSNGTLTRNQDGRQVHKGIELTATGKVTDDLTIMGGGTYLDAEVTKTNNASLLGTTPQAVSTWLWSLWSEYRLPFIKDLYLTGGVNYVGSSYLDAANTLVLPSSTVGDLGLRYEMKVGGTPLTLRMNVQNVTDKHYWRSASSTLSLGAPRTFTFSATARF